MTDMPNHQTPTRTQLARRRIDTPRIREPVSQRLQARELSTKMPERRVVIVLWPALTLR